MPDCKSECANVRASFLSPGFHFVASFVLFFIPPHFCNFHLQTSDVARWDERRRRKRRRRRGLHKSEWKVRMYFVYSEEYTQHECREITLFAFILFTLQSKIVAIAIVNYLKLFRCAWVCVWRFKYFFQSVFGLVCVCGLPPITSSFSMQHTPSWPFAFVADFFLSFFCAQVMPSTVFFFSSKHLFPFFHAPFITSTYTPLKNCKRTSAWSIANALEHLHLYVYSSFIATPFETPPFASSLPPFHCHHLKSTYGPRYILSYIYKKENIYLNFRVIDRQNIVLLAVRSFVLWGFFLMLCLCYRSSYRMLDFCICERKKKFKCGRHHHHHHQQQQQY